MAANSPAFIWYMKFIASCLSAYEGDWAHIYFCNDCENEFRFKAWDFGGYGHEFCVFCRSKNVERISKERVG